MPSAFDVIDREIVPKGKCYLICRTYDAADFSPSLSHLTDEAFTRGARSVYAACKDEAACLPPDGFTAGKRRFVYDGDFYILHKDLSAPPSGRTGVAIKPLRPGNAPLFMDLYNEAFDSVPNARTMDRAEVDEILGSGGVRSCGFLMDGGLPVGVYELSYSEPIPEIAALAIVPELWRHGYGRRALAALEAVLYGEGHHRAQLLVSSQNTAALRLYRQAGYGQDKRLSRWYRTDVK